MKLNVITTTLALVGGLLTANAQFYAYDHEVSTYQELNDPRVIEIPEEGYFLDLDNEKFQCFSDVFYADGVRGLKITREGSFGLAKDDEVAVFLFSGGFIFKEDTEVAYLIEGEKKALDRVVKVQYSNVGFNYGEEDEFINFQLWVYPNTGDFEVHVGSYLVNTNGSSYSTGSSAWGPATGVIIRDTNYNFIKIVTLLGNTNGAIASYGFNLLSDTPAEGSILYFNNQNEPIDHDAPGGGDDGGDDGQDDNGGNPWDWPVGLEEVDDASIELQAYPNPAVHTLTVEWTQEKIKGDPILMKVVSLQGQVIEQFKLSNQHAQISLDVQDWPSGNYFIVASDRPELNTRVVVIH